MSKTSTKYLGYREEDLQTPHAHFFNPVIRDVLGRISSALKPEAEALPVLQEVPVLSKTGYSKVETGLCLVPDGSIRVAVLTPMPGVSPQMWDWWFAWHGSQSSRYKLWHPGAHVSAAWQDGDQTRLAYIGRTSMIEEYLGKSLEKANIRFIDPAELGLKSTDDNVFICARVGYTNLPLEVGWLVHQVRSVAGGAEMRSRFWMGGPHIQIRSNALWARWLSKILQKNVKLSLSQGQDLLQHCAEEMEHLAAFLPELYQQFNQPTQNA